MITLGQSARQRARSMIFLLSVIAVSIHYAHSAEKVTVKLLNGPCEVVKVSKDGVVLKPANGAEQTLSLERMDPKEVAQCYRQAEPLKDAQGRFDLGNWFFKKHLFPEAESELSAAGRQDAGLKKKAEVMLAAIAALKEIENPKKEAKKEDGEKTVRVIRIGDDGKMVVESASSDSDEDFEKKFSKREVPARSAAEMKAFLDKRQEELKPIGGTWRLIETKHYYCFSNVLEAKHKVIAQWNEFLYDGLCGILKHKEGDKLWNNKLPIYYFERYGQFQRFAKEIDESPGAAYSGGYFAASGRDVHICIPFMTERLNNEKHADRMARNTLHHEGTHAFLQLSGEDVPLTRWLHEGMAQFIEFWYDENRDNNPERKDRAAYVQQMVGKNVLPSWEKTRMRPAGGTDIEGYAFAWTKLEFLYRNFDKQKLPQMIHLIKAGRAEDDALQQAFGFPVQKLEEGYRTWVKANAKTGFKFQ